MGSIIADGDYRIRCNTRNGGIRSLEAFPNNDEVSLIAPIFLLMFSCIILNV
jgi:hypothetical protein